MDLMATRVISRPTFLARMGKNNLQKVRKSLFLGGFENGAYETKIKQL